MVVNGILSSPGKDVNLSDGDVSRRPPLNLNLSGFIHSALYGYVNMEGQHCFITHLATTIITGCIGITYRIP